MSIESPSGGETCALDEVLPPLLLALVLVAVPLLPLLPLLPLALVVDDASAGDADLSRPGDRAWTASGTWADIFGGCWRVVGQSSAKKVDQRAAEILSGRGHRRSGAGKGRVFRRGRRAMQLSRDKMCAFQKLSWRQQESYDTQKYGIMIGGKDSRLLEGDSGGSCSLYIVTKAWASKRGPSGNSWRSWHFLALLS